MKCLDCDKTFKAENPDEMLSVLMPHYMSDHKDVMDAGTEESKKVWMEKFNNEWEATEEI